MKDKVKVIRKSNEVLVKAIQPQFPISGGPAQMVLTGGGGGAPRKKKSLPVRILGGAGALAGGGLGALGTLTGRHRSAGSLLQGAISGAATGSALGRGLGEKTGGLVGVGTKAAYDMRGSPTERMGRQFARMPREQNKGGSRLTYRGQPIVGGKVQVTGGSPREDGTEGTSTSAASNVINAATSENRIPGPGEVKVTDSSNPLAVAETGNPLDAMSPEQKADLEQRMNPQSRPAATESSHPVQQKIGAAISNVNAAGQPTPTIRDMGLSANAAITPSLFGVAGETSADEQAAQSSMNLDPTPEQNLPPAFSRPQGGQGSVKPLERGNSLLTGAGLAGTTPSPNQREADEQYRRLQMSISEQALNQPYTGSSTFEDVEWKGEPMDMAFRLLKMMAFYYR